MRTHRMLSILGLAVAVPMLISSMAFACEKTCSGNKASAATASAQTADAKADCAAKCAAAKTASAASCAGQATAVAAGSPSCAGKSTAAADAKHASCGADCSKACCAGKTAAMITYNVSGMTCMGCVKQVEAAVAKMELENVESVAVSLDNHNAVVTTTGPVDATAVAEAISKAGFQAEFAGAEHPAKAEDKMEEPAATM